MQPGNRTHLFSRERSSAARRMSGRLLVIVTGASRGFGKCVAEEFARKVAPLNPVHLILVARSENGLQSAADSIGEITKSTPDAAEVVIRQHALDLSDMEHLEARLEAFFGELGEIAALWCLLFGLLHFRQQQRSLSVRSICPYLLYIAPCSCLPPSPMRYFSTIHIIC